MRTIRVLFVISGVAFVMISVYVASTMRSYLTKAALKEVKVSVDIGQTLGPLKRSWAGLSQGGEEHPPMLHAVRDQVRRLDVNLIRIDHIYDYYKVVQQKDGNIIYDFSLLDETVDDILAMGAIPYFSLGYMPSLFTQHGSVIEPPKDWMDWQSVVRATIQHYSGKQGKNISGVYYEVWNEPELDQFGSWGLGGKKDYRQLYLHAALASQQVRDTQTFYLGGPAVGSYYPEWIDGLLQYVQQNSLRFDFYSWHRYHTRPDIFVQDIQRTRQRLLAYPTYAQVPLILSEWGIESGNTDILGSHEAAAFTAYTLSTIHRHIEKALYFEVKDGPPPHGGRWGILTHEGAERISRPKPLYHIYTGLSHLSGDEIEIDIQGEAIRGIAAKQKEDVNVMLARYTPRNTDDLWVPVVFSRVSPGSYVLEYAYPLTGIQGKYDISVTNGTIEKLFHFPAHAVVSLSLKTGESFATYVSGRKKDPYDKALVVDKGSSFVLSKPEFRLRPEGEIRFDMQFFSSPDESSPVTILDIPYEDASESRRLVLSKQSEGGVSGLSWGLVRGDVYERIFVPFSSRESGKWYSVHLMWKSDRVGISIDGSDQNIKEIVVDARGGHLFTIYPVGIAVDNLIVKLADQQVITRAFDGEVDQ